MDSRIQRAPPPRIREHNSIAGSSGGQSRRDRIKVGLNEILYGLLAVCYVLAGIGALIVLLEGGANGTRFTLPVLIAVATSLVLGLASLFPDPGNPGRVQKAASWLASAVVFASPGLAGLVWYDGASRDRRLQQYEAAVKLLDLLSLTQVAESAPALETSYLLPKVVAIELADEGGGWIPTKDIQRKIRADLWPRSASETRTIVAVTWGLERVGTYTNGGSALSRVGKVVLFDTRTHKVIGVRWFAGSPPSSITTHGYTSFPVGATGEKPYQYIADWVNSLPQE